jgi:hypothetical protein
MSASSAEARRDELVDRLFGSALGALDLLCEYLGDRLDHPLNVGDWFCAPDRVA